MKLSKLGEKVKIGSRLESMFIRVDSERVETDFEMNFDYLEVRRSRKMVNEG